MVNNHEIRGNSQKLYNNWSALCASQPANAAVNPVSKLKFAAGLAADPQRLCFMNMDNLSIFCADIGSVKNNNFGWAHRAPNGELITGKDIDGFASRIVRAVLDGAKVTVGFEAPMFVPVREQMLTIANARSGEGNRPWSAAAGTGALATGLVETLWILSKVREGLGFVPKAHFCWESFLRDSGIHFWEAFVTAGAKDDSHHGDAVIAIKCFAKSLPNPESANAVKEGSVLSLLGASILRAGWSEDVQWLYKSCLVIKA